MPDWTAREFRRAAIHHLGVRYYVESRDRDRGRYEYALKAWPEELNDIAGSVIEYDETYVANRDAVRRAVAKARRAEPFLLPLYPLLGFLPGGIKMWLADRFGVSEGLSSRLSLYLEAVVLLMSMGFLAVRAGAAAFGGTFGADGSIGTLGFGDREPLILLVVLPDLLMRWSRIMGESNYPYGFWEWLWHRESGTTGE